MTVLCRVLFLRRLIGERSVWQLVDGAGNINTGVWEDIAVRRTMRRPFNASGGLEADKMLAWTYETR